MGRSSSPVGWALAGGLAVALAVTFLISPKAGLSLLGGLVLGAASLSGLGGLASAFSGTDNSGARLARGIVHFLKYPLVLVVLYVMLVYLQADGIWLCAGYTAALVHFLAGLAKARPKPDPAAADKSSLSAADKS